MCGGRKTQIQSQSYSKVRIEDYDYKWLGGIFGVFFTGIIVFLIVGAFTPQVFLGSQQSDHLRCSTWNCDPQFDGYLNRLTKLHQVFYLELTMVKPFVDDTSAECTDEMLSGAETKSPECAESFETTHNVIRTEMIHESYDFDMEIEISATGELEDGSRQTIIDKVKHTRKVTCQADETKCDTIMLFGVNFLFFDAYHVQVKFIHPYKTQLLDQIVGNLNSEDSSAIAAQLKASADAAEAAGKNNNDGYDDFVPHFLAGSFQMRYVNKDFTVFEFGLKYSMFIITFLVTAVFGYFFFFTMKPINRSFEQKWIMGLLIMCCLFNDPLFVFDIYLPNIFFTGLNCLLVVSFLMAILFFWLCMLDIIRSPAYWNDKAQYTGICFYLPKLILMGLLWFASVAVFLWTRLQQEADPAYSNVDDFAHFQFAKIGYEVLIAIYGFWCLVLILVAIAQAVLRKQLPQTHFVFMFLITIVSQLIAAIGIGLGAFSPMPIYNVGFTTFYGCANLYMWIMAFAYSPVAASEFRDDVGNTDGLSQLEDDDEDDHIEMKSSPLGGDQAGGIGAALDSDGTTAAF